MRRPIIATAIAVGIVAMVSRLAWAGDVPATQPSLRLALPDGWTQRLEPDKIVVDAPGQGAVRMQIRSRPLPNGKKLSDEGARVVVSALMAKAKSVSVETDMPLTPVEGNFSGQSFACTSKTQKGPADRQFVNTIAFLQGQDFMMTVSITHRRNDPAVTAAMDCVRNATSGQPTEK